MTMSRSTARIVLVILIALAVIAATYMTVQGAFAKEESRGAQAHTVSGLKTNFNHDRSTVAEQEALKAQLDTYSQPGHGHGGGGCEHEMQVSPLD